MFGIVALTAIILIEVAFLLLISFIRAIIHSKTAPL